MIESSQDGSVIGRESQYNRELDYTRVQQNSVDNLDLVDYGEENAEFEKFDEKPQVKEEFKDDFEEDSQFYSQVDNEPETTNRAMIEARPKLNRFRQQTLSRRRDLDDYEHQINDAVAPQVE